MQRAEEDMLVMEFAKILIYAAHNGVGGKIDYTGALFYYCVMYMPVLFE